VFTTKVDHEKKFTWNEQAEQTIAFKNANKMYKSEREIRNSTFYVAAGSWRTQSRYRSSEKDGKINKKLGGFTCESYQVKSLFHVSVFEFS